MASRQKESDLQSCRDSGLQSGATTPFTQSVETMSLIGAACGGSGGAGAGSGRNQSQNNNEEDDDGSFHCFLVDTSD